MFRKFSRGHKTLFVHSLQIASECIGTLSEVSATAKYEHTKKPST